MAGSFFLGMIYDVRVYDRVLRAEDRRQRTEDSILGNQGIRVSGKKDGGRRSAEAVEEPAR